MGFNPGSTLGATDLRISVVAINTNLAAVAGSASAMLFWYMKFGKPDITMACNGMLAGLVAITAPCAFVGPTSSVIIGILALLAAFFLPAVQRTRVGSVRNQCKNNLK